MQSCDYSIFCEEQVLNSIKSSSCYPQEVFNSNLFNLEEKIKMQFQVRSFSHVIINNKKLQTSYRTLVYLREIFIDNFLIIRTNLNHNVPTILYTKINVSMYKKLTHASQTFYLSYSISTYNTSSGDWLF